ncbi:hypothetical protein CAPTEDRAFT_144092 [Capitella teleta]|uniref:Reverse transcriptase domain-containing protein n=1 Tax=Capitella teleta TaxID=283909 RepID=R7U4U3_CAPTE|nr:hypothetical protein CAPTEDRAFT_144092 [Capitella teleta]|eukprot:ELT98716.1 hypothetical protein CAPTEDRAFT_144092 [Capitella teleta]
MYDENQCNPTITRTVNTIAYRYGIRGTPHRWFTSYLSGRQQMVIFNGFTSSSGAISCGVPQG